MNSVSENTFIVLLFNFSENLIANNKVVEFVYLVSCNLIKKDSIPKRGPIYFQAKLRNL